MLSIPRDGWTIFSLNEKNYNLSYLTDVPFSWLTSAINGLKTHEPFTVQGFMEPMRMLCLVSYDRCYIIVEDDEPKNIVYSTYDVVNISMIDFCKKLYFDMNNNIDEWSNWFCDDDIDVKEYKEDLIIKLEELKVLIDKSNH